MKRFRLRYGLRWRGRYPTVEKRYIVNLVAVLAIIVLAMSLDYHIKVAEVAERNAEFASRAADIFEAKAKVLSDCENGAIGYSYRDGRTFECGGKL